MAAKKKIRSSLFIALKPEHQEMIEKLEAEAAREKRTANQYVLILLEKHFADVST